MSRSPSSIQFNCQFNSPAQLAVDIEIEATMAIEICPQRQRNKMLSDLSVIFLRMRRKTRGGNSAYLCMRICLCKFCTRVCVYDYHIAVSIKTLAPFE